MNISHSGWGQDHYMDQIRCRSNSTGEIIRGEDGSLWGTTTNQKLPMSPLNIVLPNRSHLPRRNDHYSVEGKRDEYLYQTLCSGEKPQKAPEEEDTSMPGL